MAQLAAFSTPALQQDFPPGSQQQIALDALWSTRVQGFTQQAILGDPWNSLYQSDQTAYYDPLSTDIPSTAAPALVFWNAFPNRLSQYLGAEASPANPYNLPPDALYKLADFPDFTSYPIPQTHCPQADWDGPLVGYGPYGPRGWLDEYCEWSVTRDATSGKIVRVDFVCENPEYWYTLWEISPEQAAEVYANTLNAGVPAERLIAVTVEDLSLIDPATGKPYVDPLTGGPVYNPLNKWNSGVVSVRDGTPADAGGAMHLTSTPNTLQTELGLAGGATVQRSQNSDPQALICCAQYGQSYRNSDPHIGQSVNLLVSEGNTVSLADPVGLYIQMPSFARFALPDDPNLPPDAQPSDCWQILRGNETLTDPVTGQDFPGNFILHAAFQLPQAWIDDGVSFTVGDITIRGEPIQWAGQIASQFNIGLFARPIPASTPTEQPCVTSAPNATVQPLQMFYASMWEAYYGQEESPPPGMEAIPLASNTVIVPPLVAPGESVELALVCTGVTTATAPEVSFPSAGIEVTQVSLPQDVEYAVPGNSYPGPAQVVTITVQVSLDAAPGLHDVVITNPGQEPGPPGPAFLQVVG